MTGMSGGTGGTALAGKLTSDGGKMKKAAEAFFSLQLEKVSPTEHSHIIVLFMFLL